MPAWVREIGLLYSACVAGAIPEADYLLGLRRAGLVDVAVRDRLVYDRDHLSGLLQSELADGEGCGCGCAGKSPIVAEGIEAAIDSVAGKVASIRVVGRKPEEVIQ